MIMLAMAVGMPDTLDFYKDNVEDMMFAKYQYVLKSHKDETGNVLYTKNKDAEKFNMKSLQKKSDVLNEEISVYGHLKKMRFIFQLLFKINIILKLGIVLYWMKSMRISSIHLRLQGFMTKA